MKKSLRYILVLAITAVITLATALPVWAGPYAGNP
jgi:hypothetical protein